jgi:hypothetical protein
MAQHRGRQAEWPTVKREREACFVVPDVTQRSDRSCAGPLRMGTEPGVGPKGPAVALGRVESQSDYGMDRVTPREFDPLATSTTRYAPNLGSELIAKYKRSD